MTALYDLRSVHWRLLGEWRLSLACWYNIFLMRWFCCSKLARVKRVMCVMLH
ncbi:hypothetical protein BJX65DRAFT_288946 [Aspergillus insuetus]